MVQWTHEDRVWLKQNYGEKTVQECADHLNRTPNAVRSQVNYLRMGDVIEFTGEYYTRQKRSKLLADALMLELVESMQNNHDMDIQSAQFIYDMAWVVKFMEVLIDNQYGVANRLAKFMENMKNSESRSKE